MEKLISKFVREQKRYSKNELMNIFELNYKDIDEFLKNLRAFGVLKVVKNNLEQRELSDLIDEDIEIYELEDCDCLYVFIYVGIIVVGSRIIKCYPKYILKKNNPYLEMKQILKVLHKYQVDEQIINLYNGDDGNKEFNILTVILFLINDYYEYGIYNNTEDVIKINSDGEILWDKTINESFAIISNNRPYYMQLSTKKTIDNEYDFFKRLHEVILTDCFKLLDKFKLIDLFDIASIEISEENIEDFGDVDYILYRIQSELNIQFNTRKQILLKTLYSYISYTRILKNNYGMCMYGTKKFHIVWEKICAQVLDNKLNISINKLKLPTTEVKTYDLNLRLIDIIEKPTWIGFDDENKVFEKKSKNTLIPDIVSIFNQEGEVHFAIFDAKYYNIILEKTKQLKNYPGINDITKQYLYELVYKDFINHYKIKIVSNCFLMPTETENIINKGSVNLKMFKNLGLKDIDIYLLPANDMYEKYLSKKILEFKTLFIKNSKN